MSNYSFDFYNQILSYNKMLCNSFFCCDLNNFEFFFSPNFDRSLENCEVLTFESPTNGMGFTRLK